MKIWLDTKLTPDVLENDNAHNEQIQTGSFQQKESLHIQTCGNGKWIICDPTGLGHIAVIDADAFAFLMHFRTTKALTDIVQSENVSYTNLIQAITLLSRLEFLQDLKQPISVRKVAQPETLSAWLHVTNACNLRCDYCYLHKTSEQMADDTSQRAVDAIIRSAIRHDFKQIKLKYAGGEASLQLARVLAIHDYASQQAQEHGLGLSSYTMSNGVMLSQRTIEQLMMRHIGVMISLDGLGDYHDSQRPFLNGKGSFKYVDRTITRLLANGLVPHINTTVSQRNLDGLVSLIEYILEREMPFTLSYYRENECSTHISDLQFAEVHMISKMREVFTHIEQHLPKRRLIGSLIDKANLSTPHHHTCGVSRNYLVIDQQGGIAKCHADITRTVTTIEAEDPLQLIMDDHKGVQGLPVEDKEGCRTCQWRHWCTGGCPLLTYRLTGRNDIKSPNCNIYKALFPEALHLEAMRLLRYKSPIVF